MVNKFSKHLLFVTVIVLIVVFLVGVILGKNIQIKRSSEIDEIIKETELNTESFLIEQSLMGDIKENCDLAKIRIVDLSNELAVIGRKLIEKEPENYPFLKKKYHLMQIKTYLFFFKLKQYCNETSHVILYYYGTNDKNSQIQGLILDSIVKDYDAKVFAIEYNYSKQLSFMESYYGINSTPTLIIDYKEKLVGLTNYSNIVSIFE